MKAEKFTTDSGLKGTIYTSETDGNTALHLIFDEEYLIAGFPEMNSKVYKQQEKKIRAVFKSIRLSN